VTDHQYLLTAVEDGVGIVQLNHPEKRNALGWELHTQLIAALEAWPAGPSMSSRAPAATTGPGSPTWPCG
jgi:enoyl-CoA hydratase/carnithine racemase